MNTNRETTMLVTGAPGERGIAFPTIVTVQPDYWREFWRWGFSDTSQSIIGAGSLHKRS